MGKRELIRSEIRWYTFRLPDERRPVSDGLNLTRISLRSAFAA
jgi:hypothetical protein